MRIWKIRLNSKTTTAINWDERVHVQPTRPVAVKALESVRDKSVDVWGIGPLFGFYVECYEARFRRNWFFRQKAGIAVVRNLQSVLDRVGNRELHKAIKIVFTHRELRWITDNHDVFLATVDNYEGYVAKRLNERPNGEQAEWRGDQSDVPGSRRLSWSVDRSDAPGSRRLSW